MTEAGVHPADLTKAAPAWSNETDVPQFVRDALLTTLDGGVLWEGMEEADEVRDVLEDSFTQPQGWSISSVVNRVQDTLNVSESKAEGITRMETAAALNTTRMEGYREQNDGDGSYYWGGPDDRRNTKVCEEIKAEIDARGGSVSYEELQSILRKYAEKYEGTRQGGTPERVDEWVPHYECRHSPIEDVRSKFQ